MWQKGEAIDTVFTPLNTVSYYSLMKETGRDDHALKRWHDLYKQYPEKDGYIEEYAVPKASAWTQRALRSVTGEMKEHFKDSHA